MTIKPNYRQKTQHLAPKPTAAQAQKTSWNGRIVTWLKENELSTWCKENPCTVKVGFFAFIALIAAAAAIFAYISGLPHS